MGKGRIDCLGLEGEDNVGEGWNWTVEKESYMFTVKD